MQICWKDEAVDSRGRQADHLNFCTPFCIESHWKKWHQFPWIPRTKKGAHAMSNNLVKLFHKRLQHRPVVTAQLMREMTPR